MRRLILGSALALLVASSARAAPDDDLAEAEAELVRLDATPVVALWPGFGSADTSPVFAYLDRARRLVRTFESLEATHPTRARIGIARTCEAVVRGILNLRVRTEVGTPDQVAGQADAIRGGLEDVSADWQCRAVRAWDLAARDGSTFEAAPAREALGQYATTTLTRCRRP